MTTQQKIWLLSNIYKDEQEEYEKFITLYKFVRPEAFFNQEGKEVKTVGFMESLEEGLGRKLTEDEIRKINGEGDTVMSDVDTIERVEG